MAVTITTIQPQDSLSSSRLTLNSNFAALKAGIDSVQLLLDPTTSILTGVKSATINDNAVPFSTSIFQVGKGSSLLGNVIMGTIGASTSVLINGIGGVTVDQASVTLNSGNLTLSGSSSLATFGAHVSVTKEFRLPGAANAFSSMTGLTASTTIPVTSIKYLVLSNASTVSSQIATLSAGAPGQVLEIFHVKGASGFSTLVNASNFSGLTGSISLSETADTLKCVYDGAAWYLLNYSPSSFATTSGATGSSITFTTI
jgi:hypothetical protein